MTKTQALFNWSGGKDSTLALHHVLEENTFNIQTLVTTVNSAVNRISMHGVRRSLLQQQTQAIGIPVHEIMLPEMPSMSDYDMIMRDTMEAMKSRGITHSIFGDIFLEDLRQYREDRLNEVGLKAHFPLWKRNTTELIHEFIDLGYKTVVVCCKSDLLSDDFVGKVIDHDFLKELPKTVDPCGENGEFHTFVFDGPIFKQPVNFELGEVVFKAYEAPKDPNDSCLSTTSLAKKSGFYYQELLETTN